MDQFSHPEINNLMQIEGNRKCFDCGNNNPLWASLNNSVFVCLKCAGIHRGFGVNVSFIRSLTIDAWDDRQIDFLKRGGNKRFRDLLEEFKVPNNATMDFKYMIRASDYYRKLLKAEVYTEDPPFKPDIIAGLEMLEYGFNRYPSFDNSTPICSSLPTENKPKSFFNQVGSFLSKAKDQVKSTAEVVGSKIKELEIGDKLKVTGERTMHIAKATGNFVVEKGKEVYKSEFVQNIAHKTEEGINVLIDKTKKILNQDECDNVSEDKLHFEGDLNQHNQYSQSHSQSQSQGQHYENINNLHNHAENKTKFVEVDVSQDPQATELTDIVHDDIQVTNEVPDEKK